eukprot:379662_1
MSSQPRPSRFSSASSNNNRVVQYANNHRIINDLRGLSERLKSEPTAIRIQWSSWIDNWAVALESVAYLVTRPNAYHTLRNIRGFGSWGYNNIIDE